MAGRQLEAFSIQLVILAIWKQALHICHTQAASAMEGSPSQESTRLRRTSSKKHGTLGTEDCPDVDESENISNEIEREFLREVEHAEELAKAIEPGMGFDVLIFFANLEKFSFFLVPLAPCMNDHLSQMIPSLRCLIFVA